MWNGIFLSHIYIYIYIYNIYTTHTHKHTDQPIEQVGRVFANGLGDQSSISGRIIPKPQKNGT